MAKGDQLSRLERFSDKSQSRRTSSIPSSGGVAARAFPIRRSEWGEIRFPASAAVSVAATYGRLLVAE
jgi:hypothetical protein